MLSSLIKTYGEIMKNKAIYGGQAVVEGVMFGGKELQVTAIRRKNDEIEFYSIEKPSYKWLKQLKKIPFIRGIVAMIEASAIGSKHLTFSTERYDIDPENDDEVEEFKQSQSGKLTMILGVAVVGVLSFFFGKLLFTAIPVFVANTLSPWFPGQIAQNLLEGLFKIMLLVGYLFAISQTPLIKRLFQYHGAEHKLINTFENNEPLTVENIQRNSRLHYRCGSSFMMLSVFVGVAIYIWFPIDSLVFRLVIRIALLPVVLGVSFEVLQLTNKFRELPALKFLGYPGLWLQRLTTKEPTADQIEVAIASFHELQRLESGE